MGTVSDKSNPSRGLLLVGHGTRDERGRGEFLRTAEMLAQQTPEMLVQPCYLEIARPNIAEGIAQLAAAGATQLTVVPVVLFNAAHARHDIPAAVRQAVAGTPLATFRYAEHLGCHPALVKLSQRRCGEAVRDLAPEAPEHCLLLMVGRGSRDAEATAEMHQFAELSRSGSMFHHSRIGFLAMAEPPLQQVVAEVQSLAVRRVVVQPHLLFHGDLSRSLAESVRAIAERGGKQHWVLAAHLGPAQLLVEAIRDRCLQAESGKGV